ncbi:RagB/SusD family nutrient uptake outer membrane protein [Flavobacterium sp. 2]|uniref:RagB/SusD family nutrient uptake outer membrane protein n=1 Tax=Flavobacterium sp. 2 TaxID=308053 RepID=UPI000C4E00AD|nr:RagB/SusD family nutrient uptake outer membrane protein [Flavobacterium sp. 2]PIF71525.1 putative outer membrane starch-binding protein [Flavobacterium sp. 2]
MKNYKINKLIDMKKKIFILTSFLMIITSFTSCSEDPLDKVPLDSYTDATVWNDLKLAEAFANNLYTVLPSTQHNWNNRTNRSWILSTACDEAFNNFNDYDIWTLNSGALTPDNANDFDIWKPTYATIQNCNIFLSRIDKVPGDDATRNRLKGEVIFLRAYSYFKLISDYGGVPLITVPFDLNSNFKVDRSSYDQCVDFIVTELDKSAELLPLTATSLGKITKGAALAIKSRTLLYAASPQWNTSNDLNKWKKASDAAKAVMDLNLYQLYDKKYEDLFTTDNSEIICSRLSSKDPQWSAFNGVEMFNSPSGFHGWANFAPSQSHIDAYGTADGKDISDPTSGYNPQKPYVNRDPRFYKNIVYDGRAYGKPEFFKDRYDVGSSNKAEFYEGGLDSPQGWDTWNASKTRYTFRKYCDTTYNYNSETQTNKAWIISRLGEIYLNYAEAQFKLGNEGTAIQYLNVIRKRAGITIPLAGLTGTSLEKKIRNERQVELCLEGFRYYDVRRWKIAEDTENKPLMGVVITKNSDGSKTYTYTKVQERIFKPQHYLLPIPRDETNRTSLAQNPGYN